MVTVPNYLVFDEVDIRKIFSQEILTIPNRLRLQSFYDGENDWCKFFSPDFNKIILQFFQLDYVNIFNKPSFWNNQTVHTDYRSMYALNVVYIHHQNNQELVNKLIKYNNTTQKTNFNLSFDSKMEWFKIVKNTQKTIIKGSPTWHHINFSPDDVELIDSRCIDNKIALVRVDIPHRIKGCPYQRTCFSFRFKDNFKNWEEALKYFSELNFNKIFK